MDDQGSEYRIGDNNTNGALVDVNTIIMTGTGPWTEGTVFVKGTSGWGMIN